MMNQTRVLVYGAGPLGSLFAARSEVHHLADEFLDLARRTSVPTPAIDRLYPYLDPENSLMPEGSKEITIRWGGTMAIFAGFMGVIGLAGSLLKMIRSRRGSY